VRVSQLLYKLDRTSLLSHSIIDSRYSQQMYCRIHYPGTCLFLKQELDLHHHISEKAMNLNILLNHVEDREKKYDNMTTEIFHKYNVLKTNIFMLIYNRNKITHTTKYSRSSQRFVVFAVRREFGNIVVIDTLIIEIIVDEISVPTHMIS
jgi:hypothetical protein